MRNVGLLCATHDPHGSTLALIKKHYATLSEIYENVFITVSEESNVELIKELEEFGFYTRVIAKRGSAHARREVLKFGLEGNNEYFQYCDFDRILTWCDNYVNELRTIVWDEIPKRDYIILGRTERALCTHPT